MGANTVGVSVWWEVTDSSENQVAPSSTTMTDTELDVAIKRIQAAGMRVVLSSDLHCNACAQGWRGNIRPSNPNAFFDSYRAMVNHYADIAERDGVWMYMVGTEMSSVQSYNDQWLELIRQTRDRYSGLVSYEANFDAMTIVGFWSALDVVSINAYFPLSDAAQPTLPELVADWHDTVVQDAGRQQWFDDIAALARATAKPIFFGEAGYLSATFATQKPWDYTANPQPDWQLQSDAYQALLETFDHQPWWMGVMWWEWHIPSGGGDLSYTPRDKPSEQLLSLWWAQGWRPSAPTNSVAASLAKPAGTGAVPLGRQKAGPSSARTPVSGGQASSAPQSSSLTEAPASPGGAPASAGPGFGSVHLAGRHRRPTQFPGAVGLLVVLPVGVGALSLTRRRARPPTTST